MPRERLLAVGGKLVSLKAKCFMRPTRVAEGGATKWAIFTESTQKN